MTFEDKLTLFLMIVAVFAVIIIIIVLVDMFLDAKTKKDIEIVETEKVVEKVVKEGVKPVPTKPQVVKPNANTMPGIEVKQGNETLLCIDENGVVKQPKNQNVNVTINK